MSPLRTTSLGLTLAGLALALACGGSDPAPPEPAPSLVEAEPLQDKLDVSSFATGTRNTTLVPSPRELQAALSAAGLQTTLATLVPDRSWKLEATDPDRVAVRTGVILADLLLTVKTATDEAMVQRLRAIQTGMKTLDGSADIDATIQDLVERIQAGAIDRPTLLAEFDELAQVAVPELEFHGKDDVVPLIKAGSWLAGANLVARAAKKGNSPVAATGILKQPEVVAYFRGYTRAEEGKVPTEVSEALDASLSQLESVATTSGVLETEHLDAVATSTQNVLELL